MWVLRQWHILRNWQIWQGFIKGLAKNLNETTKEAYWQLAIFTKMARIYQRFCKNSNEVTKRGNLTNGDYKKMANLGENGKFRQKWRVQEFGQIQMRWQKGASWQMTILSKWQVWQKFIKVWQKCKQDDKRGMSIIVGFTKMTYFAKLANLAKDSLHVKVWQKI